MKTYCPFLLLIFLSTVSYAQEEADSLYLIWQNESLADSARALAFYDYIYEEFFYSDVDSAIILTNQLYRFSEKANFSKGMTDALTTLGYAYFRIGNYPTAMENYKKSLDLAEKVKDKKGTADILLKTGYIYHDNADLITAISYYQRSLKLYEEIEDAWGIGSVYNEYGGIYSAQNDPEKALDYYQKAIDIYKNLDAEYESPAIYLNIGTVYLNEEKYTTALDYFQKGLSIYQKEEDHLGIAAGLGSIGDLYVLQNDYDKALDYLQQSLRITEDIAAVRISTATLLSIGEIFTTEKKYNEATATCKKSLRLAQSLGDIDDQMGSCDCLYKAAKAMGKSGEALMYHEKMLLLSDSLKAAETATKIQNMEFAQIRLADSLLQVEKNLETEMLHQQEVQKNATTRNIAISLGLFFLMLAGGFYSRWQYVRKSKAIIEKERDRSESLLLNILPAEIAEELKEKGSVTARDFEMVSILFSDFEGFTQIAEKMSAQTLIVEINFCFKAFDRICERYGIEKIKTIGDAYMAVGGLPLPSKHSVKNSVLAALEMQSFIENRKVQKEASRETPFQMRLGIHTGPVVAGIVGVKKFQYDIWGDTVNIASRMESSGAIGKVNISQNTYELIKEDPQFTFEARGKIQAKGKGEVDMYFVSKKQT